MNTATKDKRSAGPLSRMLTAAGLAACVLLGCLLLCNLTIIIRGTLDPERPPSVLGVTPMVVLSGSMSGTQDGHIEVGDLVFVARTDPATLAEGDVIAFMNGQSAVTHRITAIETDADGGLLFTTKGDANQTEDTEPVTEDQLLGVYCGRIPRVGDFALFLQQPLGMLLFADLPLLAFIIYDIIRRQRDANRQSKRTRELEAELARLRGAEDGPQQAAALPADDEP